MTPENTSGDRVEMPLLVYDGECRFCVRCVERLKFSTGDAVEYVPFQDKEKRPSSVSDEDYSQAVHLFMPGGEKPCRGAEAVCQVLAIGSKPSPLALFLYDKIPLFARFSEGLYRVVARQRMAMSTFTSILWGKTLLPSTYRFSSWLFGRALGLVALVAFLSYWSQAEGLIGPEGIMPFDQHLEKVESRVENHPDSPSKEWLSPTLLWYSPTWNMVEIIFGAGVACSALLVAGVIPALATAGIWICYLSVMTVGPPFLNFQWDILLLETCLLSVFFLPWKGFSGPRSTPMPSRLGRLLIICLLFKLMFESGIVKFTYFGAEDANAWSDFTALEYHYWTQPIPTWTSWHIDRLPASFDKASLWFMYVVELVLPFFFFLPRNPRRLALGGQILLQACIMASGNYGFFNFLTLVLCLPLLDDQALPRRWRTWLDEPKVPVEEKSWAKTARLACITPLGGLFLYLGWIYLEKDFVGNRPTEKDMGDEPSEWSQTILQKAQSTHSLNSYGLFRVMTTTRPELIVEASMDGESWQPYAFKWKPGDQQKAPEFFIPHMPRLDWQMWFEALNAEGYAANPFGRFLYGRFLSILANGGTQSNFADLDEVLGPPDAAALRRMNPGQQQNVLNAYSFFINSFLNRSSWFAEFLEKLAHAEPKVLSLLEDAPFGREKPRFLRITLWQYEFASPEAKGKGYWWKRDQVEPFETIIEITGTK